MAAAIDWYDLQSTGLGDKFQEAIQRSLEAVRDNPYQYQILRGELRRAPLAPFSYIIIYGISDDEVVVLRCIHGHRDPRSWPDRL